MKKDTFEVYKAHLAPLHLYGLIGGLIALQFYRASLKIPIIISALLTLSLWLIIKLREKNTPDILDVVWLRFLTMVEAMFLAVPYLKIEKTAVFRIRTFD